MPDTPKPEKLSPSRHPAARAVAEAAVPRKSDGSVSWGQFTTTWTKLTFAVGVVAALWKGFAWIDDKLDSIENSAGKVKLIQENLAGQDERIAEHFNKLQERLTEEFSNRDDQVSKIQHEIDTVRREMRARHGVYTDGNSVSTETPGVPRVQRDRIRQAVMEAERARIRTHNARPREEPLHGVDGLK